MEARISPHTLTARLYTIQSNDVVSQLLENGSWTPSWDYYNPDDAFTQAYRWLINNILPKEKYSHPPIWLWHSCGSWLKPPTLVTARMLLSDYQIEKGVKVIALDVPTEIITLSNYGPWNDVINHIIDHGSEEVPDLLKTQLSTISTSIKQHDDIQATVPSILSDWIVAISEIQLSPGQEYYQVNELLMPQLATENKCNECESSYRKETSFMSDLCPECAHLLYAYDNCEHLMENGRCLYCYWDGSRSAYTQSLLDQFLTISSPENILDPFVKIGDNGWLERTEKIVKSLSKTLEYELPPPYSAEDISEFEKNQNVQLPHGLRLYYEHLGAAAIIEKVMPLDSIVPLSKTENMHWLPDSDKSMADVLILFSEYLGNGNQFYFHRKTHEVYYLDHDTPPYLVKLFTTVDDYLRACLIYYQLELFDTDVGPDSVEKWCLSKVVELYGKRVIHKWMY